MTGIGSGRPEPSHEWSAAYSGRRGAPKLVQSAVLFIDLLGVSEMARRRAAANLRRLREAIKGAYRDFIYEESPWPAAAFSDTLVLASPLLPDGDEESAIAGLIPHAARLQHSLVKEGFFARGALTWAKFHIYDGLIFGPALVEAAELEQRHAVSPRILISRDAQGVLERSCAEANVLEDLLLLRDADGQTFINYLAPLLDEVENPTSDLEAHRNVVTTRLEDERGDKTRWEKYRWVAEYHNAFVDRHMGDEPSLRIPVDALTWRFDPFP